MITLRIPTNLSEVKNLIKDRTDKRYKHNKSLFDEAYKRICSVINSGYWRNDISKTMRDTITSPTNGIIREIILECKSKVK
nr:MAG TPA: hypothetical protein [Caudoviricetes sp.]